LEAEARDVDAGGDDRHHLDRAAGEAERRREQRVGARPRDGLVHRRRQDALFHVLIELATLEVAAQHVAGAQLADAEVLARQLAEIGPQRRELLTAYLHSSAPLRQT